MVLEPSQVYSYSFLEAVIFLCININVSVHFVMQVFAGALCEGKYQQFGL